MAGLNFKATLNTQPFNSGLKGMESKVGGFASKLQGAYKAAGAAVAVGAMVKLGKATLDTADNIDNLSKQLQLGLESTQSLKVMMDEAGMSITSFNTVVATAKNAQAEALTGNKQFADSFAKIGIELDDLRGMNMEQVIEATARAMAESGDNAEVNAAAIDILGSRSVKLEGVLKQLGSEGFSALNARMLETGQIMGEDLVRAGDALEEGLTRTLNRTKVKAQSAMGSVMAGASNLKAGLGSLFRGDGFGAGVTENMQELLGHETAVLVTVEERAAARKREADTAERLAGISRENAKAELAILNEKRSFFGMSKDDQTKLLQGKKEELEMELQSAETAEEKLRITQEIFDLEKKIGKEKVEAASGGGDDSMVVGRFRRIGGQAGNAIPAKLTPHEQRQINMQQKMLEVQRNSERLLREISQKDTGATF